MSARSIASAALLTLAAMAVAAVTVAEAGGEALTRTYGPWTVVFAPGRERAASAAAGEADLTARRLEKDWGVPFGPGAVIVLLDRPGAGSPAPGDLRPWQAGLARPSEGLVYVKLTPAMRGGAADIRRTVAHEMAHLYFRRLAGGAPLPRWLDEGLAMREAGEWEMGQRVSLSAAALRGDLPPVWSLDRSFPDEEAAGRLAYAAAYSFTGRLLRERGRAGAAELMRRLALGEEFPAAFRAVWGAGLMEAEAEWRASLTRFARWVALAAGGTSAWTLAAFVFLVAWWRKRLETRRKLASMDEEDGLPADPFERH